MRYDHKSHKPTAPTQDKATPHLLSLYRVSVAARDLAALQENLPAQEYYQGHLNTIAAVLRSRNFTVPV